MTEKFKLKSVGLTAGYGKNSAVQDISLSFAANTVTALIGPSGCGKSTFIRCLNRMHETIPGTFVKGEVLLDGKNIFHEDPVLLRRRVGMVFQKPNPFPTLSIFDNVVAGLRLNGVTDKNQLLQKAEESLQRAALWNETKDKLNAPGISLSGGQQQRLCIARALAVSPDILLMDEPCSALDPISTTRIEELIHELRNSYTIVIVTHNMQQAARVSDQTAFLYMGEMVECGETKTLFTNPTEKKTEDYITGRFG